MTDKEFLICNIITGIGLIFFVVYLIYKHRQKNTPTNNLYLETNNYGKVIEILNFEIECPFCHNKINPLTRNKISTGGVIMIIVGLVFTPILIGVAFIIAGIRMKECEKFCPKCSMKLQ